MSTTAAYVIRTVEKQSVEQDLFVEVGCSSFSWRDCGLPSDFTYIATASPFLASNSYATLQRPVSMGLETLPRTQQIAVISIGLGIGFGAIPSPRRHVAEYFTNLLGDAGGFVAGLFALGITGAVAGLLLYASFKWLNLGQDSSG
jgi:hypothetical protein